MPNGSGLKVKEKPKVKPAKVYSWVTYALVQDEKGKAYLARILSEKEIETLTPSLLQNYERASGAVTYYLLKPDEHEVLRNFDRIERYAKEEHAKEPAELTRQPAPEGQVPDMVPGIPKKAPSERKRKETEGLLKKASVVTGKSEKQLIASIASEKTDSIKIAERITRNKESRSFSFYGAMERYDYLKDRQDIQMPFFQPLGASEQIYNKKKIIPKKERS